MRNRGQWARVLVAIGAVGVTAAACGSLPPASGGLSIHAGPDIKATQALAGEGATQTYRAVYRITGSGSTGGRLSIAQLPPRAAISSGTVTVYTASAASDQSVPTAVRGAVVCRTPASGSGSGSAVCTTERTGATDAAALLGVPVSRGALLAMLEQDAQLIEEGNPGGMLRSVTRTREVIAGQPSTCLHAVLSSHIQTVCTTPTGIPTLVTRSTTTATLVGLSPTVPMSDLVPPVAATATGA